jgi:hypothetical protein
MNGPDTLRAAAHALRDCAGLGHGSALAGLLHNRADDMERNIINWRRTGQDVSALVEKHYGVYLTAARTVLTHSARAVKTPQMTTIEDRVS